MLHACANCASIWSPGTEEFEEQKCSACGWHPGQPTDEDMEDDDFYYGGDVEDDDEDDHDEELFDESQLP